MITFREATEKEIPIIRQIAFDTWPSAYYPIIGKEQVNYMLEKMYSEGELQKQFLEGNIFLIASDEALSAGFAGFSIIDPEKGIFKLHKLYVLPEKHGTGMGKILLTEVINQAKARGGKSLELNVNKQNSALKFYEHCGFTIKEAVTIDIGNGFFMDDYVMRLPL
jgi:ribosomal protein S18 acetylase RimI-like enzyme